MFHQFLRTQKRNDSFSPSLLKTHRKKKFLCFQLNESVSKIERDAIAKTHPLTYTIFHQKRICQKGRMSEDISTIIALCYNQQ